MPANKDQLSAALDIEGVVPIQSVQLDAMVCPFTHSLIPTIRSPQHMSIDRITTHQGTTWTALEQTNQRTCWTNSSATRTINIPMTKSRPWRESLVGRFSTFTLKLNTFELTVHLDLDTSRPDSIIATKCHETLTD